MREPIASTTYGPVRGAEKDGILRFRGIPFGTAPRFRPPEPPDAWHAVRDALHAGPQAPQNPSPLEAMLGATRHPQDEHHCLSLNVWTPNLDDRGRPVMVWIHGGAYTAGSGAIPWYDGTRLAAGRDVVVVSINYRLGVFGFGEVSRLFGDEFAGSGNNGLRDQIAALTWVRDNIGEFGGDPGRVTIFGESAGGGSVACLLAAPAAHGLFHAAIAQSGPIEAVLSAADAASVTELVLAELEVDTASPEQLLRLPVEDILAAQEKVANRMQRGEGLLVPFAPVVDGVVLPATPLAALAAGASSSVPVIAGCTSEEWNLFALADAGPTDAEHLRHRVARFAGESAAPHLVDAYRREYPALDARGLWNVMATDAVFRVPVLRLAEAHQGPTWVYDFSYRSTAFDGGLGACHAIDIPFVFDNLDRRGVDWFLGGIDDTARGLASAASGAWAAFAWTGVPAHPGLPDWPQYAPERRSVMELGRHQVVHDDPGGAARAAHDSLR